MKRHVALVGFMASGKSTIGRKLARKLGWTFRDTDRLVVRSHGPIPAIFEKEGEAAFRHYEHVAIADVLESAEPCVIALGGGALTVAENRSLLTDRAYRIFIKTSAEQILARVRRSREVRPMLGSRPTLSTVKELYARRMAEYENADHEVDATRRRDGQVVDAIVGWLRDQNLGVDRAAS